MYYKISRRKLFKRYIKARNLFAFIAVLIIISVIITLYQNLINEKIIPLITIEAEKTVMSVVNTSVNAYMSAYGSNEQYLSPVYDSNGNLTGYTVNADAVVSVESIVSEIVTNELKEKKTINATIPSGSLTDIKYFSGKGIPITYKSLFSFSVSTNTESSVKSVGINHTLYTASLLIDVHCELITLGQSKSFSVNFSKMLAERIIIGEVPLT